MVPLLAATSAVSAVSSIANDAVAAWQDLTASRSASKSSTPGANASSGTGGSASDSFSALLSAQGVDLKGASTARDPAALQGTGQHGTGHHGGHHHVDRTA
jgi:hypothetical protein